ncbi:MAG: hypothetical protein ABR552_09420, partial [Actinomycetota bacterium]
MTITLFGDGGVGVGGPIGSVTAGVGRTPTEISVAFPPLSTSIDKELVLSVSSGNGGAQVLYDSTLAPSSLTFDLDDYVPPPPPQLPLPSTGWGSVGMVSLDKANRESSLAIDPTNENRQLICSPSGVPATGEGHSYFFRTTDDGATWSELQVETSPTDTRSYAFEGGDCDVAFDRGGTAYTADTWAGDLSVGHSTDGGSTWDGTALAGTSPVVDRPWLVGGAAGVI